MTKSFKVYRWCWYNKSFCLIISLNFTILQYLQKEKPTIERSWTFKTRMNQTVLLIILILYWFLPFESRNVEFLKSKLSWVPNGFRARPHPCFSPLRGKHFSRVFWLPRGLFMRDVVTRVIQSPTIWKTRDFCGRNVALTNAARRLILRFRGEYPGVRCVQLCNASTDLKDHPIKSSELRSETAILHLGSQDMGRRDTRTRAQKYEWRSLHRTVSSIPPSSIVD